MKTVIVTGSSNGIGKQIALEFAENNYNIIINYNKSKTQAFALDKKIKKLGSNSIVIKADVSKLSEAQNLIDLSLKEFGKIDILVNNAGISLQKIFQDVSESEWQNLFAVNIGSVFNCCSCALKDMISRKSGKIINISSIVGINGNAGQANYASAKAGIIGMTKSVAKELASRNVTANAIAPGFIATDMTASMPEKAREAAIASIPMKRAGQVDDIANTALFLASDEAGYITGEVIRVDGGMGT